MSKGVQVQILSGAFDHVRRLRHLHAPAMSLHSFMRVRHMVNKFHHKPAIRDNTTSRLGELVEKRSLSGAIQSGLVAVTVMVRTIHLVTR